jgi:epoxyqueuosine reductase QueG
VEQLIRREISRFVAEDERNRFPGRNEHYFEEPLLGIAAADDPLFGEFKAVIGDFHLTPAEIIAASFPDDPWTPTTVICWVLPVSSPTKASNRREKLYPSRQWAQTRNFGEAFNSVLRRHIVGFLSAHGHQAAAPQLLPAWQELRDTPVGIASTWSERHAAYAAGLGTFSLNDAMITSAGIAHRLGSVITNLPLEPSLRPYPDLRSNCLYFREGTCGQCIGRCPVDAISKSGHDKDKCRAHVYGTIPEAVAEKFGVTSTGCGLCQTMVPCEGCIPPGRDPYPFV